MEQLSSNFQDPILPYRKVEISENLKVEDLLSGVQAGNPSPENRTKCQDSPDRSSAVDGETGQAA